MIIVTANELLLFGLVGGTHSLWPQFGTVTIHLFHLGCLYLAPFIIGHGHVNVLIVQLTLNVLGIVLVHVFL